MNQLSGDYSDLTIIIPTLNEEKTISLLLSKIEENAPNCSVIISDDGSKDKTKDIVEKYTGQISTFFLDRKHEPVHGLTISVLDAILKCSTPYFLVMDGDLQHPADSIPQFYEELKQGFDLIAGNRIKVVGKWPFHRKLMSYIARLLGNSSLFIRRKNRVKDIMTGLFASHSTIWVPTIENKKTKFIREGYKVLFDFLKLYKGKMKISHVDYTFGTRNFGESKINKKVIWMFFKSLF